MSFYNFYDNDSRNNTQNYNNPNNTNFNNQGYNNTQSFNQNYGGYGSQNFSEDNIQNAYQKYSGLSQNELYNEFMKETAKQKANGSLNPEKLNQIKSTIMPYLSPKEQETLNKILNDIM